MDKPAPTTTYVQTDPNTFREMVQRLTGSFEAGAAPPEVRESGPPPKVPTLKRQTSKLLERRQCTRPKLEIIKPSFQFRPGLPVQSPRSPVFQSPLSSLTPQTINFVTSPAVLSPMTPGIITSPLSTPSGVFSRLSIVEDQRVELLAREDQEEEKAIRERRFYLHPSPRSGSEFPEPELLPLFPLTPAKNEESSGSTCSP